MTMLRAFGGPLDGYLIPQAPEVGRINYGPTLTGHPDGFYLYYEAAADEPHPCIRGLTMRAAWPVLLHAGLMTEGLLPERCKDGPPAVFEVDEDYLTIAADDAQMWEAGILGL